MRMQTMPRRSMAAWYIMAAYCVVSTSLSLRSDIHQRNTKANEEYHHFRFSSHGILNYCANWTALDKLWKNQMRHYSINLRCSAISGDSVDKLWHSRNYLSLSTCFNTIKVFVMSFRRHCTDTRLFLFTVKVEYFMWYTSGLMATWL